MRRTMRFRAALTEDRLFRTGAALTGATLTASAILAADLARMHMASIGTVCGAGPHPHCGWCLGAASLVLAGLAAFRLALAPLRTRTARIRPASARKAGLFEIKAGSREA